MPVGSLVEVLVESRLGVQQQWVVHAERATDNFGQRKLEPPSVATRRHYFAVKQLLAYSVLER
jgi:hypothetical protein